MHLRSFEPEDVAFLDQKTNETDPCGGNRYEFILPRRGGGKIPVIQSSRFIQCEAGNQILLITSTDISEQKRVQAELEEANYQLMQYQNQMAQDLHLAEQVQHAMIPNYQRIGALEIATRYIPMMGIGGDYVYVRKASEDRIYLSVCDVVGYGVAAALIANYIQSRHPESSNVVSPAHRT